MENENAYQAPQADVENSAVSGAQRQFTGPKSVPIGHGWKWIADSFGIFSRSPGQWILTMIVGFIIAIVLSLIPIIGQLFSSFSTYIWTGGIMMGCAAVARGEDFKLEYLFAGFKHRLGALFGLSCLVFLAALVVMLAVFGGVYFDMLIDPESVSQNLEPSAMLLPFLLAMALFLPLFMAIWFAPVLITVQNMGVFAAMGASFKACLQNILPFLIYGIIMLLLLIVASIPLMLGLLVVMPMFFASMYTAYEDIFTSSEQDTVF